MPNEPNEHSGAAPEPELVQEMPNEPNEHSGAAPEPELVQEIT
jgi:hypothetical protein